MTVMQHKTTGCRMSFTWWLLHRVFLADAAAAALGAAAEQLAIGP